MNTIKQNTGLPDVFRSKRFVTSITGLFAMVLVGLIPGLEGSEQLLQQAAFALTVGLVGSFTGQDWIVAVKQGASKYQPANG